MQNVILHLDMNSYFASVEQQDNLAWRGKPVGVCEHLGGLIIGASVEAKKWGITTGTPVWEAKKLYPKIILTHTRPEAYRSYTKKMIRVVSDYTDKVEVYSIDEVFADLTRVCNVRRVVRRPSSGMIASKSIYDNHQQTCLNQFMPEDGLLNPANPFEEAVRIAQEIKRRITSEVGDWLRCSIGIAENKLQAKIASDMQKPDGLVIVRPPLLCHPANLPQCTAKANYAGSSKELVSGTVIRRATPSNDWGGSRIFFAAKDNQQRKKFRDDSSILEFTKDQLYHRLKLTDIPGIGRRMERRLNELGIRTLRELRDYPKSRLVALFGIPGYHLHSLGQLEGSFKPQVEEDKDIKSLGHMYTLPQEFRDKKYFVPVLYKLSEMVAKRLRDQELMGNVLFVGIYGGRDGWVGKSRRLKYYLWDGREIFAESVKVLEEAGAVFGSAVKLIGVSVGGLKDMILQQSLFGSVERQRRVAEALDQINEKYGDFTICRVPVLSAGKVIRDSVGFGRTREL